VIAYSDTGLVTSTTYVYRVSAFNSAGASAYSNKVSVVLTVPAAPTQLTAAVARNGQVTLNWQDHSNNETGFQIERSSDGNVFTAIATVATDIKKYKDVTAAAGQTYFYRVTAKNNVGLSNYTNVVTTP
jgi:fibronectin type 3 domain-containing protein